MKKTLAILLIFSITFMSPYPVQTRASAATGATSATQEDWDLEFSSEQLENLVAPIALYPDPLLAQILVAATFPDQIDEAAREIRAYGRGYSIDMAPWDVSVKAVAHYPTVLSMMADKLDWTTTLGQAYVNQSTNVMEAVQHLRRQARSYGNLMTTPQQQIVETDGFIYIYPAQPQYIYVPVYDPAIVYVRRPAFYTGAIIGFGIGFLIGAWLNHDCDWHHHRVFYHGWGWGPQPGPIWVMRSRPHVHITNIYVNRTYTNVVVNRTVINRHVNYGALNRYNSIHRDVDYSKIRRERGPMVERREPPRATEPHRDNKIIRRNIDPNDRRIESNRGRGEFPRTQPEARKPDITPRIETHPGAERRLPPTLEKKPPVIQPLPRERGNVRVPKAPETVKPQPKIGQNIPMQRGNVEVPRVRGPVFSGNRGAIDPGAASQRGQASRHEQVRSVPQVRTPHTQGGGQVQKDNQTGPHVDEKNQGHGRRK